MLPIVQSGTICNKMISLSMLDSAVTLAGVLLDK